MARERLVLMTACLASGVLAGGASPLARASGPVAAVRVAARTVIPVSPIGPSATAPPPVVTTLSPSPVVIETPSPPTAEPAHSRPGPAGQAPHVMLVVMENREYGSVIGNAGAPYINELARSRGLATRAFGRTHPSLPNYLDLVTGGTQGITDDCTSCSVEAETLTDQLVSKGISWGAYMEGIDRPCPAEAFTAAGYAKKHNPLMYVRHIARSPEECGKIVPATRLPTQLAADTVPAFALVVPTLCDDGHDCPTATADSWLSTFIPAVTASRWYRNGGVIIVTWDEGSTSSGCCGAAGGHIATLVLDESVADHRESALPVDHAGVLRTIETIYGVPWLGEATCACTGDLLALLGPTVHR